MKHLIFLFLLISFPLLAQEMSGCWSTPTYVQPPPTFEQFYGNQFQPLYDYYVPWWYDYSAPRYQYYNTGAPWINYGMDGSYYHHSGGGGMVGKPNVYVYGKEGTRFQISLEFEEKSNLLSTSPTYETGWEGVITNGGILSDDAFYTYFYYDYAVNVAKLQWEKGSCVKEQDLMKMLNYWLVEYDFKKKEIDDFNEYWTFKMPQAEEYCVFPQGNKELDRVAKLKVTPAANINRLTFFIVPQIKIPVDSKAPYFKKPRGKWVKESLEEVGAIYVNEWGVAWLSEK